MKVIISNVLEDKFSNFILVDSFKRASELSGVDTLIIHKYAESDFDVGVFVTTFHKSGVQTFVYISDTPSSTLRMALIGVKGYYFEDEFYLEDEEELIALLNDLDSEEGQLALAAPALDVIGDFVGAVSRGEERAKTPVLMNSVSSALNEVSMILKQQEVQLTSMGESAIEVFERSKQIIGQMNSQNKLIEAKLRELEMGMSSAPSKATFSNSIMFFAPYTYRSNSKLLLIREYSPVRYLTSFILGYLHHLHYELNRRPKLVFVVGKGAGIASKYGDFPIITQDNMSLQSLYDGEVVVTNNPKREVMKDLLSKPNDVFIVVDRLYSSVDIVSGRLVKVNAVGSRSDIARYNVKPEDTIFTVTKQPKQFFDIPVIKSFPTEPEARYATYSQVLGDRYSLLDFKLGLKVSD